MDNQEFKHIIHQMHESRWSSLSHPIMKMRITCSKIYLAILQISGVITGLNIFWFWFYLVKLQYMVVLLKKGPVYFFSF